MRCTKKLDFKSFSLTTYDRSIQSSKKEVNNCFIFGLFKQKQNITMVITKAILNYKTLNCAFLFLFEYLSQDKFNFFLFQLASF